MVPLSDAYHDGDRASSSTSSSSSSPSLDSSADDLLPGRFESPAVRHHKPFRKAGETATTAGGTAATGDSATRTTILTDANLDAQARAIQKSRQQKEKQQQQPQLQPHDGSVTIDLSTSGSSGKNPIVQQGSSKPATTEPSLPNMVSKSNTHRINL